MKKEYPLDFTEPQKDWYDEFIEKVLKLSCKKCKTKTLKKIGLWSFKCISCGSKYSIKKPPLLKKGLANSNNWKATCEECGGIMDYYNLKYCCRKCGHILKV